MFEGETPGALYDKASICWFDEGTASLTGAQGRGFTICVGLGPAQFGWKRARVAAVSVRRDTQNRGSITALEVNCGLLNKFRTRQGRSRGRWMLTGASSLQA